MWDIESGECCTRRPERTGSGQMQWSSASTGAEDLADVVQVLAEGITRPDGQLVEQVVGTEFRLESVVIGEPAIGAETNIA